MLQAKCIEKFRDSSGKIYGYKLQDINGEIQDVQPENLKIAIKNKQIHIVNLTLTRDNRLVDSSEKQLQAKVLGKAPVITSKQYESLAKALVLLDKEHVDLGLSYDDIVDNRAAIAKQNFDVYSLKDYHNNPKFKDCKDFNEVLDKVLYNIYIKLLNTDNKEIANIIGAWEENDSYSTFEAGVKYENVDKITKSKIYNALKTVLKYAKEQRFSKEVVTPLEKFLSRMKIMGVASMNLGYKVGNEYYKYLDPHKFGVISNDVFTVGKTITSSDMSLHKEYKGYSYVFHKDINKCGKPEVALAALFKNTDSGDVQIDIKLARRGYLSAGGSSVGIVAYIKDIDSITVNPLISAEVVAKNIANLFNGLVPKIYEIANNYQSLYSCKKFDAPVEKIKGRLVSYTGHEIIDMTVNRCTTSLGDRTLTKPEKIITKTSSEYKVVYSDSVNDKGKHYRVVVDFSNGHFVAYAIDNTNGKEICRESEEIQDTMENSSEEIADVLAKLVISMRYSKWNKKN